MKFWWGIFSIVFALSAGVGNAQMPGPPQSGERREWNQRYGQLTGVLLKRDLKSYRQMVSTAAVWTLKDGRKLTAAQMEKEYIGKLDAVKYPQFTLNITKLDVKGANATVERTQIISGFYKDQGKDHRGFDGSGWEDKWIKTPNGWKLKQAKQFNEQLTVDGRPGDPYAHLAKNKI